MATTIGKMRGILSLDARQFDRQTDRSKRGMRGMGREATTLSSRVSSLGRTIVAAAAGFSAFRFFQDSVRQAGDAQESISRFEQVFGVQADAVDAWAARHTSAVGRSKTATLGSLSSFQSFFVGLGFGNDEASGMSTTLQRLSTDFASFNNMTDDESAGRFISALSGSSEVLDRFGINIKVAALDQELLALGFAGGTAKATEQQKAIARLSVIMKSMTAQGAVGDAVRTAGSYTNRMKAMNAASRDLKESVGGLLLPVLTKMVELMATGAEKISEFVEKRGGIVKVALGFLAVTAATAASVFVVGKIISVGAKLVTTLRAIATGQAVVTALSGPKGWAQLAIGIAVAAGATVGIALLMSDAASSAATASDEASELADQARDAASGAMDMSAAMAEAGGEVEDLSETKITQLRQRLEELGKTEREIQISGLLGLGATASQVDEANAILDRIDSFNRRKQAQQEHASELQSQIDAMNAAAAQAFENTRTPAERLAEEIGNLRNLFSRGLLDPETMARALRTAREEFNADLGLGFATGGVGALERGSAQAFSAIQEARRESDRQNKLAELVTEAQVSNDLLSELVGEGPAVLIEETDI